MELTNVVDLTSLAIVSVCLTEREARELRDALDDLLTLRQDTHYHVSSDDYQTEVRVRLLE